MIYPEISDVYIEPLFPNLFSTLVKIFATITDESGIDYTTIHYQIGDDEIKDMIFEGPFVGGVAGIFNGEPKDGVLVQYHIETINNLGNEKWYPSEVTWESFTYDGSAPTTTLTISDPKFGEPPYVTFDTILTLTCNDTISSCDKTYFKETSETEWNEYTEPLSAPLGTPDGSYIIYYYSLDNAGNEEVEKTQEIILDNTNPEVTLNELNEFYSSVPVNLEFTYSDSGSGINEYKVYKKRLGVDSDFAIISGISCNTIDDTTTCEFMDGLKDGKFEFKVEVIDNVGNSQDSNIVSATLDRAGPDAVNLDSPDDSSYLNEQPLLSWFEGEDNDDNLNPAYGEYGVSGIEEYELELDGEEPITLTELSYQTLELNEGSHSWRVRANDNAGNTGIWSETRTFVIDTTLPEISDMAVNPYYEGSIYVAGTVTASATVTDDNGINSVTFSLGDEECDATNTVDDAWACDIDTISLGDGEYNLIVTAVDVAENENVDDSLIVTVDNTVPSTIITSPEEHSLFASYFDVEIEYSDDGSGLYECQYRVFSNGIPTRDWTLRDCNADITITVGEGMDCNVEDEDVCKVEVRATDNLGNENIVVERTFSIDWTNPPQILSSGPSGTIQNKDTLLYVETNKPATCRYDTEYKSDYDAMSEENEMENTLNGLLHTLPLEDLTDKTYNYYVICKDTVNNEMSYPASISFDVDTRETFAVTIPETKGDYLRIGWNQFFLPSFVLEDTSLTAPYLVEDVLASIGGSYDIIYHYDGTIWRSYEPGRPVNDLIDLTEFNGGVFPYFIDMNVSGERIEISY